MNRNWLNFWLDMILLLNFLAVTVTGAVLRWGVACGWGCRDRMFGGWSRAEWLDLHFWLAVAITVNILLHIAFHWNWICCHWRMRWPGKCPGRSALFMNFSR